MKRHKQQGNVFFIILIAVVLFAALIYAFTDSGKTSASHLSPSQVRIVAADMMTYAKAVEGRVQALLRKGCSESEINFNNRLMEHPTYWAEYNNANSPSDKSCHVFEDPETNFRYKFRPDSIEADSTVDSTWNTYTFVPTYGVEDIGTSDMADLLLLFKMRDSDETNKAICTEINKQVGATGVEDDLLNVISLPRFHGSMGSSSLNAAETIGDLATSVAGRATGCIHATGFSNSYLFYHVLIAR